MGRLYFCLVYTENNEFSNVQSHCLNFRNLSSLGYQEGEHNARRRCLPKIEAKFDCVRNAETQLRNRLLSISEFSYGGKLQNLLFREI